MVSKRRFNHGACEARRACRSDDTGDTGNRRWGFASGIKDAGCAPRLFDSPPLSARNEPGLFMKQNVRSAIYVPVRMEFAATRARSLQGDWAWFRIRAHT